MASRASWRWTRIYHVACDLARLRSVLGVQDLLGSYALNLEVTMAVDLENVEIEDFIIRAHQRAREELRRARRPHAKYCLVVDAQGQCALTSRKELALRYAREPQVGRQIAEVSASPYNFDELPVLRERADGTKVAFLMDSFCGAKAQRRGFCPRPSPGSFGASRGISRMVGNAVRMTSWSISTGAPLAGTSWTVSTASARWVRPI
jgi:hypothetical protein